LEVLVSSSSSSSSGSGEAVGTAVTGMFSEVDAKIAVVDVGSMAESEISVAPTFVGLPVSCGYGIAVASAARALMRKMVRMILEHGESAVESVVYYDAVDLVCIA
jgi:hypothetical protein